MNSVSDDELSRCLDSLARMNDGEDNDPMPLTFRKDVVLSDERVETMEWIGWERIDF